MTEESKAEYVVSAAAQEFCTAITVCPHDGAVGVYDIVQRFEDEEGYPGVDIVVVSVEQIRALHRVLTEILANAVGGSG